MDWLLATRLPRDGVLIALGGGVIGDLVGFCAAIYQRGIDFVQLPTTLLAQVDSSVGGKTGVNHPRGKNMIGAFHQPQLVLADIASLTSLPQRERRSDEHTSELQSLMRNSYAVFCLRKKKKTQ